MIKLALGIINLKLEFFPSETFLDFKKLTYAFQVNI